MDFEIIRVSDKEVVDSASTREDAEKKLIFYDTEEQPHIIKPKAEDHWS